MRNKIKRKLKTIEDKKFYSPNEICKMGLISETVFPIYRLIKNGKIDSVNVSSGKLPQYRIKGVSLKNFVKSRYKIN